MHYFTPKRCSTSNKIMYHDKAQAQHAADQSLIERGAELWVYRCEYCGTWHLTHRDPAHEHMYVPLNQQIKPHSRKKGYKPLMLFSRHSPNRRIREGRTTRVR